MNDVGALYLTANALIVVSFLLFAALRSVARAWGVGYRQWIAIAQALLALSVLSPLALRAIPARQLPRLSWADLRMPELAPVRAIRARVARAPLATAALGQPVTVADATWSAWSAIRAHLASGVALLLSVLVSAAYLRMARGARGLRALLRRSVLVRSIGKVRIVVSDEVAIPFSARFLPGRSRCWVVVPSRMIASAGDARLAIRHELQHHRQGDTAWAFAIESLACAFVVNPAIRAWKKIINELQEFSCDEALLTRKGISSREYGSCLVRVAEAALGHRATMHVGTTCMATVSGNPSYFKSFLRRRIEMFTSQKRRRATRWGAVMVGTLASALTVALAFGADRAVRPSGGATPNPGVVVVDAAIQKIADRALADALKEEGAKSGFILVSEPRTGRILAVANQDQSGKRPGHWVLGETYEPASLNKSLIAAYAIEKGATTPEQKHACEHGNYRFGDRVYHDWKQGGWDELSTEETVARSSDICGIKIAEKIGEEGLRGMLSDFGFGPGGTAQGFPESKPGLLPPPDDPAHPKLIPWVASGFGFRVTPIEMMQAYGAIANGGMLMEPIAADASDSSAHALRRVLSPESSEKMREILRKTGVIGTAAGRISSDLYSMAGKTASSHSSGWENIDYMNGGIDYMGHGKKGDLASFIGFSPVKDPRVQVYVVIRNPADKTGAHGSAHAAPVFKRVTEEVLKHWKVTPDWP